MFCIKRVKAKNFMSYEQLDLDWTDKPIVLINAENPMDESQNSSLDKSNGFGKSTVAEIISYALYGRCLRTQGTRIAANELIKGGKIKLEVELTLEEYGKDNFITIKRTLDLDANKTLEVYDNGILREFDKRTDVEKSLKRWLGTDFDMLMHRFLTPENTNFIALSPAERFRMISSLLSFNWDKVWLEMTNKCNALKTEITTFNKEIQSLKIKEASLSSKYELMKSHKEMQDEKLVKIQDRITSCEKQITKYQDKLIKIEQQTKKYIAIIKEQKEEESVNSKSTLTFKNKIKTLKKANPAKELKKRFSNIPPVNCTYCGKPLDVDKVIKDLATERENEIKEELVVLSEAYTLAEEKLEVITKAILEYKDIKTKLSDGSNLVKSNLKSKEAEIELLKKEREDIEKTRAKVSTEAMSLQEVTDSLNEVKYNIETLNTELNKKQEILDGSSYIKDASKSSSQARLGSIAKLLPDLSRGVSRICSHMFGRPIELLFSLSERQLVITSNSLHIPTLSTGEKRSVDISLACTIQDMALKTSSNQIGFFIADELFDGLDAERTIASINLIKSLKIPQIVVITHNDKARELVGMIPDIAILRVTNSNGTSRAAFVNESEELPDEERLNLKGMGI